MLKFYKQFLGNGDTIKQKIRRTRREKKFYTNNLNNKI